MRFFLKYRLLIASAVIAIAAFGAWAVLYPWLDVKQEGWVSIGLRGTPQKVEAAVGPINNVVTENTTWQPDAPPWDWVSTTNEYTVRVVQDITAGQVAQFEKEGEHVAFQPMALEWTNDLNQIQPIAMPSTAIPIISSPHWQPHISWPDSYGIGIGLSWDVTPNMLIKTLSVDSFSALPAPEQYIIDGGNPNLRYNFIFDPSAGVDIYVDGGVWDQKSETSTASYIEFKSGTTTLWGFAPGEYYDSGGNVGYTNLVLDKSGNNLYVSVEVPFVWLQTAAYPVFIDPSVDSDVGGVGVYTYLSSWEWHDDGGMEYWRCPGGDCVGVLDMRSIPQMSIAGGDPQGYGLFAYEGRQQMGGYYLGDGVGAVVVPHMKGVLRSVWGLSQGLENGAVGDVMWELYVDFADPTGETSWKPLRGSLLSGSKLYFANGLVRQTPLSQDILNNTIAVYQIDYARLKSGGMSLEQLRKVTGAKMLSLWGRMGDDLLVPLLGANASDGWGTPSTTYTESFNQGDSSTVGPDLTWTEVAGDWSTVSNELASDGSGVASIRAEHDMSGDDHYAQITVTSDGGATVQNGAIVRYASAAENYYTFRVRLGSNDDNRWLKVVNGTPTGLGSEAEVVDNSVPNIVKAEADGSSLNGTWAVSETNNTTDTTFTGQLRGGVYASAKSSTMDAFVEEDLVAGDPVDIAVSPTSYDFGAVVEGSTDNTTNGYFTLTNNSTVTIDVNIKSNGWSSGGSSWTWGSSPGADTAYINASSADGGAGGSGGAGLFDIMVLNATDSLLCDNVSTTTDPTFEFRLYAPTSFSHGDEQTTTITLTASAS